MFISSLRWIVCASVSLIAAQWSDGPHQMDPQNADHHPDRLDSPSECGLLNIAIGGDRPLALSTSS
ncbi:MAG: hypothetical protein NTX29_09400, partial [Actinobacteria bacterium]|nr:hypothetical protein [Actinomycetota bacterium]